MSCPNLIRDNRLLWLQVPKKGTPAEWGPGVEYNVGDTVIPRSDIPIPPGLEDVMFQVISKCGRTNITPPVFPLVKNHTVGDGQVLWITRDPDDSPTTLSVDEYYLINRTVEVI